LHEALADYGVHLTPQDGIRRYVGRSEASTLADIESQYRIKFPPEYIVKKRARTTEVFEKDLKVITGVAALIQRLPIRKCIASGSRPERLEHSLKLVGLWDEFAPHVFSATQVKNGKPAPDLFLFAAQQMGESPASCLVIEDSVAGIRAAKAAGMCAYGFTGGSHCDMAHGQRLMNEGADMVFAQMDDLGNFLTTRRNA
jgi:HAD superfamily hydrolase (TIGR01509 family)